MDVPAGVTLRPYQEALVAAVRESFRKGNRRPIVQLATGGGKCLGAGVPVMLADGRIVPVECVRVGDQLMGPDGTPRNVLSLGRGVGPLYRVTPMKGEPYVVNAHHILSLKMTSRSGTLILADGSRIETGVHLANVNVDELYRSHKTAKHCLKGWRAERIEQFHGEPAPKPVPPYIVGAFIGDGSIGSPALTKPDGGLAREWCAYGESLGLNVVVDMTGSRCPTWRLTRTRGTPGKNPLTQLLDSIGILKERRIPPAYLYADAKTRAEVLAGLIDSDGHISHSGCDWITKHEDMARDFAFLCRSLGLACYLSRQEKGIKATGFKAWYWRASVSGDLSVIPMRDKKCPPRVQIKRHLVHGIKIEPIDDGEYFGFEIDGDHLFLLGDFTVTHNTALASDIVRSASAKGNACLVLAPRRELINQFHAALARTGVDAGIIMAGVKPKAWLPVQVASFDTLHARAVRKNKMKMPSAAILVADEVHLTLAETRKTILSMYPDAFIVGLTATPARGDGRGLGEVYDDLILGPSMRELTAMGYLVPAVYYAPSKPDLTALKLGQDGDYREIDLGRTMDKPQLVGDIVSNWKRLAPDRRTVVFCVNCAHSRHVCEEFVSIGVKAEHLDGETPTDEREAILARLASGATQVLCNVFVASYGLDVPAIDCIVLARPTKNITLYLQIVGRGLRPFPGKDHLTVIDHAGAVDENGYADDYVPWSLDPSSKVKDRKAADQQAKKEPKQITCGQCSNVFQGRRICPNCGWEAIPAGKAIPTHQADLVELKRDLTPTLQDKAEFMAQLKGYADKYRKKEGWAEVTFRDKFGESPRDSRIAFAPAVECGDAVRKWIISRNIRYAKGKGKAA